MVFLLLDLFLVDDSLLRGKDIITVGTHEHAMYVLCAVLLVKLVLSMGSRAGGLEEDCQLIELAIVPA